MYADNPIVLELIALLKKFEIRKIVVSPGSRHRLFVASLEQDSFFTLYSVVDERSAAFFALGLIQASNEKVAITCSSGTACMNYGSAIVEAFYQQLPLLVLSSDRIPYLLNQGEDQMYGQIETFKNCTKYHAQLPVINNETDRWYCNRLINEGLIALTAHGCGPVHLNIPILNHHGDKIAVDTLPEVRKITHHTLSRNLDWNTYGKSLSGKKIVIVWGQSVSQSDELNKAITLFLEKTGGVILTDKMSNCHNRYALSNTLLALVSMHPSEINFLMPDIIITLGGNYIFNNELKRFLKNGNIKHWQVGPQTNVCDPFWKLTEMFEMNEVDFFLNIVNAVSDSSSFDFRNEWIKYETLPQPRLDEFDEIYPIGKLIKNLPDNSNLQLANSNTIRFAHYFTIKPSIKVNCNRGVNGIDGSMSTAVGFSAISDTPTFYITGELSFFYDMNSLWIRHKSNNMRILLINNNGGAVMYDLPGRPSDGNYPIYLATGHNVTAKGWAEDVGFTYISARNKEEVDAGIKLMLDFTKNRPVIMEVFTDYDLDGKAASCYFATLDPRSFTDKVKGRLSRMFKSPGK